MLPRVLLSQRRRSRTPDDPPGNPRRVVGWSSPANDLTAAPEHPHSTVPRRIALLSPPRRSRSDHQDRCAHDGGGAQYEHDPSSVGAFNRRRFRSGFLPRTSARGHRQRQGIKRGGGLRNIPQRPQHGTVGPVGEKETHRLATEEFNGLAPFPAVCTHHRFVLPRGQRGIPGDQPVPSLVRQHHRLDHAGSYQRQVDGSRCTGSVQHSHGGVGRGAGGRAVRCQLQRDLVGFGGEQCERVGHPWTECDYLTDNGVTSAGTVRHHHVRPRGHRPIARRIRVVARLKRTGGGAVDAHEVELLCRWAAAQVRHPQRGRTPLRRRRSCAETDILGAQRKSNSQSLRGQIHGLHCERALLAFEECRHLL